MVVHAPPLTQRAPARATTLRTPVANPLEGATIAVTTMLLALGVLCVATAVTPQAIGGSIYTFMLRYGVMAVVGLALFFAARKLDLTKWSWAIAPLLAVSLGLLVLVRVMGQASSGGQRWLAVGSFSFEPSELFTLVSCLYVATVVARAEQARAQWLDVLVRCSPVAVGAILILAEPDYGTGSVLLLVSFVVLVLAGMPRRLIVFLCAVAGFLLGLGAIMARYRMARVEALFHAGPAAASYQVIQAKIALGSGRISGLGLGQSRAKWGLLPNPHTDFIFAIVGEQFGFIGAVALLGLFLWLITLGMRAGYRAPDRQSQLLACGVTLWFAIELIINVGSVEGVWPVTGIPLPLISYGGTSLIIDMVALGLLCNVARRTTTRGVDAARARAPARRGG